MYMQLALNADKYTVLCQPSTRPNCISKPKLALGNALRLWDFVFASALLMMHHEKHWAQNKIQLNNPEGYLQNLDPLRLSGDHRRLTGKIKTKY